MLETASNESQQNQQSEGVLDQHSDLHPVEQFYSSPEQEQEDSVMENYNDSTEGFHYS